MTRAGLFPACGLLLLSLLWASGWVLSDLFPSFGAQPFSLPLRQAGVFSAFAAMTASIAVARRLPFPRGRRAWANAGIGLGFFVIPTGAAAFAQGWISNLDAVAALCLTPVFAVVLEPYLDDDPPRRGRAALAGALVAVAGVLCLFPLAIPRSLRAGAALLALLGTALAVATANCVAVRLARSGGERSILPMAAQASGFTAVCFAVAACFSPAAARDWSGVHVFFLRALLIDLPDLLLLFWLMSRMGAARMTARFLLAPLFASLAGLAFERMLPPPRAWIGIVLLAGGSGWLVFGPEESGAGELHSLGVIPVSGDGSRRES